MAKQRKPKSLTRKIIEGVFTGIFVALIGFCCFVMISNTVAKKKSDNQYAPTRIGNSYMPLIVLTDSMEPEIKTKSAIFIKEESCEKIVEDFSNGKNVDLTFDDIFGCGQDIDYTYSTETLDFLVNYTVDGVAKPKTNRTTFDNPASVRTLTHRLFHVQINEHNEFGENRYYFFVEGINTNSKNYGAPAQYQVFTENELYGVVAKSSVFVGRVFSFAQSPIGLIILLLIPSLYMILSSIYELIKANDIAEESEPVQGEAKQGALDSLSEKDIKRLKEEMLNQITGKDEEK